MKKHISLFCLSILIMTLSVCGGGSGGTYTANGAFQKGPFVQGTTIEIQELDDSLNPTGTIYNTLTIDHTGRFNLETPITTKYVEVISTGYYFNEVTGALSDGTLTLRSISDVSTSSSVNVNILTTLTRERIITLVRSGKTYAEARTQAEAEMMTAFGITASPGATFDKMDITQAGVGNGILLAISAILQQGNSVAQLTELIYTFSQNFGPSGTLSTQSIINEIATNSTNVDMAAVRANLLARYTSLGVTVSIPAFESYIHKDFSVIKEIASAQPGNIAVDSSGNIYVQSGGCVPATGAVCKIRKYNSSGTFVLEWGEFEHNGVGNYKLEQLTSIKIDSSNNIYVSDGTRMGGGSGTRLRKYNTSGTYISTLTTGGGGADMTYDEFSNTTLAIDYMGGGVVERNNATTGAVLATFASTATQPCGIKTDASGYVYVADVTGDGIHVLDSNGVYIRKIALNLTYAGYYCPFAVDSVGNIYALVEGASGNLSTMYKYNNSGTKLKSWIQSSSTYNGVTVTSTGIVYLSDYTTGNIVKLSAN